VLNVPQKIRAHFVSKIEIMLFGIKKLTINVLSFYPSLLWQGKEIKRNKLFKG
jgi:hypothetical protein